MCVVHRLAWRQLCLAESPLTRVTLVTVTQGVTSHARVSPRHNGAEQNQFAFVRQIIVCFGCVFLFRSFNFDLSIIWYWDLKKYLQVTRHYSYQYSMWISFLGMFYGNAFIVYATDMNSCNSFPCKNGGTCTNMPESYMCSCPDIWKGTNCEQGKSSKWI